MKIRFKQNYSCNVIESFDEETEQTQGNDENFQEGEMVEGDIFGDHEDSIDFQFGDGSCVYGIPKSVFEEIPEIESEKNDK